MTGLPLTEHELAKFKRAWDDAQHAPIQKMTDDTFTYRIGKLSLAPDDVVLIKTDLILDGAQVQRLLDRMVEMFAKAGYNNKMIVLSAGVEIEVLSKTA